jgi:hypothetical protein
MSAEEQQEATWLGPTIFTVVLIAIFLVFRWVLSGGG